MSRYCSTCGKANKACLCPWIASLTSNVELIILQHPSEQDKPLGTARILSLSLANCRVFIGEDFSEHPELLALLSEQDVRHFVLYPSESSQLATSCEVSPYAEKVRVILLDGTWKKAYKMYQLAPCLHSLPALHLPTDLKGNYRIRKAPSENALSTVEAGYHLLSIFEPERDFSPLLGAFEQMIAFQIQHIPEGEFEKNYTR